MYFMRGTRYILFDHKRILKTKTELKTSQITHFVQCYIRNENKLALLGREAGPSRYYAVVMLILKYYQCLYDGPHWTDTSITSLFSNWRLKKPQKHCKHNCTLVKGHILYHVQRNIHLGFLWGPVASNTKLRKILTEDNLTLSLLTWNHWNWN
jgi:hypothetical protein